MRRVRQHHEVRETGQRIRECSGVRHRPHHRRQRARARPVPLEMLGQPERSADMKGAGQMHHQRIGIANQRLHDAVRHACVPERLGFRAIARGLGGVPCLVTRRPPVSRHLLLEPRPIRGRGRRIGKRRQRLLGLCRECVERGWPLARDPVHVPSGCIGGDHPQPARPRQLEQRAVVLLVERPRPPALQEVLLRDQARQVLVEHVLDIAFEHLERQRHATIAAHSRRGCRGGIGRRAIDEAAEHLVLERMADPIVVHLAEKEHLGVPRGLDHRRERGRRALAGEDTVPVRGEGIRRGLGRGRIHWRLRRRGGRGRPERARADQRRG